MTTAMFNPAGTSVAVRFPPLICESSHARSRSLAAVARNKHAFSAGRAVSFATWRRKLRSHLERQ